MRASALLLVVVLLSASSSLAADATQARARLAVFNDEIKRAVGLLQGTYGKDPEGELRRVDEAATIAAGIEGALTEELKADAAGHDAVRSNLAALKGEIENSRLAATISSLEAKVRAAHKGGAAAAPDDVAALEQALSSLRSRAGPGWQQTVAHFDARVQRVKRDRESLAAVPATAAASTASVPAPPPPAQPTTTTADDALLEAMKVANRARRKLEGLLEDHPTLPVTEDELKAYLEAASRVGALSERAGRYYTTVYRQLLVANAWRRDDEGAFAQLPNLYQGDLVESGRAKDKLTVRLTADDGWCYTAFARYDAFSGVESVSAVEWSAQEKGVALARFDVPHAGPGWQLSEGVCPSAGAKLTLKGKLEGADKKNALRFVVVGWPRENLPAFVVTYMRVLADDRCDDDGWFRAWTSPVPGSLVYKGEEPFLVVEAGRPPADEVELLDVNGERLRAKKAELRSKPPPKRTFATAFKWTGCAATSKSASPEAEKLSACLARLEKKHGPLIEKEESWVARSTNDVAREKAQARLDAARERLESERAAQCEPLEARVKEKVKRTFDRILDLHEGAEILAAQDRADQLAAEQEAQPDLR